MRCFVSGFHLSDAHVNIIHQASFVAVSIGSLTSVFSSGATKFGMYIQWSFSLCSHVYAFRSNGAVPLSTEKKQSKSGLKWTTKNLRPLGHYCTPLQFLLKRFESNESSLEQQQ